MDGFYLWTIPDLSFFLVGLRLSERGRRRLPTSHSRSLFLQRQTITDYTLGTKTFLAELSRAHRFGNSFFGGKHARCCL